MNTPLETVHGYMIVQWTQHWRIVEGRFYRDALACLPGQPIHLVSFPDVTA